jgi:hemoglobin-like flavoprotein
MEGWKEAYGFLADLLIGLEDKMKKEQASMEG